MQKWSPEPFAPPTPAGGVVVNDEIFASDAYAAENARLFRGEAGFTDRSALMNSLTPEERSEIFELVEMDVAAEYASREEEHAAAFAAELETVRTSFAERFDNWSAELTAQVAQELKHAAEASAQLAIQLAEKIVRAKVAVDREVLARSLATILYKLESDQPLTVHVSPEDAAWLEERAALREQLHIGVVTADRRVETGGAVVRTENREWDATLAGQLETLAEIVREMIATADEAQPGDNDEPGLE